MGTIYLAQNRVQWCVPENGNKPSVSIRGRKLFGYLTDYSFLKTEAAQWIWLTGTFHTPYFVVYA